MIVGRQLIDWSREPGADQAYPQALCVFTSLVSVHYIGFAFLNFFQ